MGKWSKLKDKLVRFAEEPSYQSKIDAIKPLFPADRLGRCEELVNLKKAKEIHEEEIKDINLKLASLDQLLVEDLETMGETKVANGLGTFSIKDVPYAKVVDQPAFLAWIRQEGLEEILTVNYNTMAAMAKDRLEKNEPLPAGVGVFMKATIGYYKPRE